MMRKDEVQAVIALIEQQVPRSDATAKLTGMGEVVLYTNQAGYITLAAEFLRCALGHSSMGGLNDVFSGDSEFTIDFMVTTEAEYLGLLS